MYLAEDRILCWELVSKRGSAWLLQYQRSAYAETVRPSFSFPRSFETLTREKNTRVGRPRSRTGFDLAEEEVVEWEFLRFDSFVLSLWVPLPVRLPPPSRPPIEQKLTRE
jgi:hypothetical protein